MSFEVLITGIIGIVSTVVSGVVTFFQTKKKYNTEVESQQIQNMNAAFDLYKKAMEELMEVKDRKIEILQQEVDQLRDHINILQKQIITISRMINVPDNELAKELRNIDDL